MIRNLYSLCFLVLGMGLPLVAKNAGIDRPAPSTNSKAGSKVVLAPAPAAAVKDDRGEKKMVAILTPDVSRGAVSPALLAKQQALATRTPAPVTPPAKVATRTAAPTPAPVRIVSHDSRPGSAAPGLVIRNSSLLTAGATPPTTRSSLPAVTAVYESDHTGHGDTDAAASVDVPGEISCGRLARVTAYWAAEGDYYTERCISATGVRLHDGHCAVDPSIIPYGSVVQIAGVGKFLAVDTGSAVISRTAAREGGHTSAERRAIVVDLFFEDRSAGEKFAAGDAKYVAISWWTPSSMGLEAKAARSLFVEEDWTKIQGKQL